MSVPLISHRRTARRGGPRPMLSPYGGRMDHGHTNRTMRYCRKNLPLGSDRVKVYL